MTIGQLTKQLRKSRSLRQGTAAKELGISQTYLSQLEKGTRNLSSPMVDKLSLFYGIPAPIMSFLTLDLTMVAEDKREAFTKIKPAMDAMVREFFALRYTCDTCLDNKICEFAFDGYNTNGDCLAIK